jgi:hypothetical protein
LNLVEDSFYLKLLLAFAVGSVMVTLATVAAERLGSKVGGLIGGLPTMVAITLFFIGYVQSPQTAAEATGPIPLIMGFNGIFLVVYVALSKWGAWIAMGAGFAVWMFLASLIILLNLTNFAWALLTFVLLLFGSYQMLDKKWRLRSAGKLNIRYTPGQILARALFSGGVAASAVYLSKVGGPVWGGVMAPFPVVYLSTLFILARSWGVSYSLAITKSLLVSGLVNVVVYAFTVRYSYPALGLGKGTLVALAFAGISAFGTYSFMKRMT